MPFLFSLAFSLHSSFNCNESNAIKKDDSVQRSREANRQWCSFSGLAPSSVSSPLASTLTSPSSSPPLPRLVHPHCFTLSFCSFIKTPKVASLSVALINTRIFFQGVLELSTGVQECAKYRFCFFFFQKQTGWIKKNTNIKNKCTCRYMSHIFHTPQCHESLAMSHHSYIWRTSVFTFH